MPSGLVSLSTLPPAAGGMTGERWSLGRQACSRWSSRAWSTHDEGGAMDPTPDQLVEMYRRMVRIRHFEEAATKLLLGGEVPGGLHTSIGQEAEIVGSGIPVAAGAALGSKMQGTDRVTLCFFGDGASNEGTFHEGLNLAAIWKLPVVFVAENNGYAESTPVTYHMSCRDIADRAAGYGMQGVTVDGLDLFAVYEAAGEAVARARRGEGPSLIECKTYRYYGHFE